MGESSPRKAKSGAGAGKGKVKAPPKNILSDAQKKVHVSRPLAHAAALTPAQDVLEAFAILDADRAGFIPGRTLPPPLLPPPSSLSCQYERCRINVHLCTITAVHAPLRQARTL